MTARRMIGFHRDDEDHWVAELACGHTQHVRHDPPWQQRAWVTTPDGRAGRLGQTLHCVDCDRDPVARPHPTFAPETSMSTEVVVVRSYGDELEAELARATLEANGIDAMVQRTDAAGLLRAVQAADLLVRAEDAADARELLDTPLDPLDQLDTPAAAAPESPSDTAPLGPDGIGGGPASPP